MKQKRIRLILIILVSIFTVLIGILTSVATSQSISFLPFSPSVTWIVLGIVTLVWIGGVGFLHYLPSEDDYHKESTLEKRNRLRMLAKVRTFWIGGVLDKSLHGTALIALGLREQRDAVANPWRLIFQQQDQQPTALPASTPITQVYDSANGELLILGEPGSGKTTLLLELTRNLLDRAEKDDTHPIPVVFNLSSWAVRQQLLSKWLVEELNTKYQVPRKIGQQWMDTDQLLLLLDGLDEVSPNYREACIDAINVYRREHGLVSIVVCSRSTEYLTQTKLLLLQSAVIVQPLTLEQIEDYLQSAGEKLAAVREAFHQDKVLFELATTPLMLSIITLAYQGIPVEHILMKDALLTRRQQVFATYVQRMLSYRQTGIHYSQQRCMHWLTWLAKQMQQRNQTEFYIERLQIDWLSKSRQCQLYTILVCGLLVLLISSSINGLLYWNFLYGFLSGLTYAGSYTLLNGISAWLVEKDIHVEVTLPTTGSRSLVFSRKEKRSKRGLIQMYTLICHLALVCRAYLRHRNAWFRAQIRVGWPALFIQLLMSRVGHGILVGLLGGIVVVFLRSPFEGLINGTLTGVVVALAKLDKEIKPAEIIVWSWTSFRQNAMKSLIAGLCLGLIICDFPHISNLSIFLPSVYFALCAGLGEGFLIMLVSGFSRNLMEKQRIIKPNQGIWNSFYNSARLTLILGLGFGFIMYFMYSYVIKHVFIVQNAASFPPNSGLILGVCGVLIVTVFVWPINGGLACIQHLVLRIFLWKSRYAPWNYPRFLDYAYERILLRKVGGGYVFVHRLLLEYFASLNEVTTGRSSSRVAE